MISLFVRFLVTLILLPLCYASARSFVDLVVLLISNIKANNLWIYFVVGFLIYAIFQTIFFRPVVVYVFGHELTHALIGLLSGARVKAFKIKGNSGNVTLTKSNILITLSPYFIPIYSLLIIIIYWLMRRIWTTKINHYEIFLFLLGVSVSFHIFLTIYAIKQGQSDLKMYGVINSLLLVFIANCVFLGLMFCILFKINISIFLKNIIEYVYIALFFIYGIIRKLINHFILKRSL